MNATKALTQLGFVTARGLDNGDVGALLLSNQVGVVTARGLDNGDVGALLLSNQVGVVTTTVLYTGCDSTPFQLGRVCYCQRAE